MMKTIKQCQELTGLPYSAIRNLCVQNKIKYFRSGTKYYIYVESLIQFLSRGEAV